MASWRQSIYLLLTHILHNVWQAEQLKGISLIPVMVGVNSEAMEKDFPQVFKFMEFLLSQNAEYSKH